MSLKLLQAIGQKAADKDWLSPTDVAAIKKSFGDTPKVNGVLKFFDDGVISKSERQQLITKYKLNTDKLDKIIGSDGQKHLNKHLSATVVGIKSPTQITLLRTSQATKGPQFKTPESIKALIKASKNLHWQVQVAAIMELSDIKAPGVHKALVAALSHPHQYVQIAATNVFAIRNDKRAIPLLMKALDDPVDNVRNAAAEVLSEFKDPRPIRKLLSQLKHKDPYVRQRAAETLGALKDLGAIGPLINLLADKTSYVWQTAAKTLLRLGSKRLIQLLFTALMNPDPLIQKRAKELINKINNPQSIVYFLAIFLHQGTPLEARSLAAAALQRLKDIRIGFYITKAFGGLSWSHKLMAMKVLVAIRYRGNFKPIRNLLGDKKLTLREAAIKTLAELNDWGAVSALMKVAEKDRSSSTRGHAVKALARLGDNRARTAIIHVLKKDSDWGNRMLAADALGVLKGPQSVQALMKASGDNDEDVREAVAMALGKNKDPKAISTLKALGNDKDPKVRTAAAKALIEIGGPKAMKELRALLKERSWDVELKAEVDKVLKKASKKNKATAKLHK